MVKSIQLHSTIANHNDNESKCNGGTAAGSAAMRAYAKTCYQKNKAVIAAKQRVYAKNYYQKNKAVIAAQHRVYLKKRNGGTAAGASGISADRRAYARKYYHDNRANNKIKKKAYMKKWHHANDLRIRDYKKQYNAKRAMNNGMMKAKAAYAAWYYAKNKQTINATKARKRAANKDRLRIVRTTQKTLPAVKARLRAYQALPATKERIRARNKARAKRVNAIENEYVTEFLRTHPDVQPKSHLITDAQIEGMLVKLLDSRTPTISAALQGFTLREAFVNRKLYASLYIWLARGSGVARRPGQKYAESERFLVRDPNPILTNGDDGKHYRVGSGDYRDIGLVSIPLATFDTASACSRFETHMQKFFDFRRYGIEKLWKRAGAGKLYQKYRRCDISAMQRTGSNSLVYTCGITVLHDVRMASSNASNYVTSIRSGDEGVLSTVNQPARWTATLARDRQMFGTH